jgi:hypothetical protein
VTTKKEVVLEPHERSIKTDYSDARSITFTYYASADEVAEIKRLYDRRKPDKSQGGKR